MNGSLLLAFDSSFVLLDGAAVVVVVVVWAIVHGRTLWGVLCCVTLFVGDWNVLEHSYGVLDCVLV